MSVPGRAAGVWRPVCLAEGSGMPARSWCAVRGEEVTGRRRSQGARTRAPMTAMEAGAVLDVGHGDRSGPMAGISERGQSSVTAVQAAAEIRSGAVLDGGH